MQLFPNKKNLGWNLNHAAQMALGAKDILVLFTFKRLKPCEVKGVGKLTVNNPENWDYFFILVLL